MSSFRDRIEWVIANRRQPDGAPWTAKGIARASGLSPNTLGPIMRGEGDTMRKGNADKIAATVGVSAAWLMHGVGSPDDNAADAAPRGDSDDPRMANRPGFDVCLSAAKLLRPQHPAWVWTAVAESDPLVTAALTPVLVAELSDLLLRHMHPPTPHHAKH